MINGTKLLNVTGMSRGKRDGILKNEKGRVVVKVGAMHLKGVWVTFARAKALAIQFNIVEHLHPLFVDDPALYFYSNQLAPHNYFIPNHPIYLQSQDSFQQQNNFHQQRHHHRHHPTSESSSTTTSNKTMHDNYMPTTPMNNNSCSSLMYPNHHHNNSSSSLDYHTNSNSNSPYHQHTSPTSTNSMYTHDLPSAPSVPSMIPVQTQMSFYGYTPSSTCASSSSSAAVADTMHPY
ncbi:transcription regulator HTH, apses-type DNA-binding domain-containing protein [Gilbertella persicaria]|uniref:transcription regulator HTH, apses-type DNA-binding domain-containing protein n=1 Tax=Gilbertella persicaria TaxID=101096 RepID=UPI00221FCE6D|nr:transcription regulator HTH, apses-type DNA-binding domain-containing protein [Gilbertella persicaria]KAI8078958.1 transcription regulator HTH, apses-type DNA-binding domain-containing protein [Gilbertella persicaria]